MYYVHSCVYVCASVSGRGGGGRGGGREEGREGGRGREGEKGEVREGERKEGREGGKEGMRACVRARVREYVSATFLSPENKQITPDPIPPCLPRASSFSVASLLAATSAVAVSSVVISAVENVNRVQTRHGRTCPLMMTSKKRKTRRCSHSRAPTVLWTTRIPLRSLP